jgi:uncharacterized protein YkwD
MRAPLVSVLLLAACLDKSGDSGESGNSSIEEDVNNAINEYRASIGLPALVLDAKVSAIAREHSDNMYAETVPFSHDGFEERTEDIFALRASASSVGENVGYTMGYDEPVPVVVQGWLDSPPHKENIDGEWTHTGIGVAEPPDAAGVYYVTPLFVLDPS